MLFCDTPHSASQDGLNVAKIRSTECSRTGVRKLDYFSSFDKELSLRDDCGGLKEKY